MIYEASDFGNNKEHIWFINKAIKKDPAVCRAYANHAILEHKHLQ